MTTPTEPYAASTIAMTVYNLVSVGGRPYPLDEIYQRAKEVQHRDLTKELFARAIDGLIEREWIVRFEDTIASKDPKRRLVSSRSRCDCDEYDEHGRIVGGWNGWRVNDYEKGPVSIDEALGIEVK